MTTFTTDNHSIITLADVPHPTVCEDVEKRHVHKLWEGANTGEWIKWILHHNNIKWTTMTPVKPPDCMFYYYITEIDGIKHNYSAAKKDGKIWAVAEDIDMSWYK
tara:strand:- start:229 stop:543 length:315 start_codon:yes stop_codon:yes gene_type:complete